MLVRLIFLGLSIGAFYALVALGFSLVFSSTKLFNLAHGELLLLGAYAAFWAVKSGVPFAATFAVSTALLLVAGLLMAGLGMRIKKPLVLNSLLVTLGLAFILQNLYVTIFGGDFRMLTVPSLNRGINLGLFWASGGRLAIMAMSLVLLGASYCFLNRTQGGLRIRATIQNHEAARLSGIDVRRTALMANVVGAVLIGLAGPLFAVVHYLYPQAGIEMTIIAVLITILAGVGRTGAVILAGVVIGILESMVSFYIGGEWQEPIVAGIIIVILFAKPTGLLPGEEE